LDPATKSLQTFIIDEVDGGGGGGGRPTQFEVSPFKIKASNSTSPLEN
jgi:hypothetical protein